MKGVCVSRREYVHQERVKDASQGFLHEWEENIHTGYANFHMHTWKKCFWPPLPPLPRDLVRGPCSIILCHYIQFTLPLSLVSDRNQFSNENITMSKRNKYICFLISKLIYKVYVSIPILLNQESIGDCLKRYSSHLHECPYPWSNSDLKAWKLLPATRNTKPRTHSLIAKSTYFTAHDRISPHCRLDKFTNKYHIWKFCETEFILKY